MVVEILSPGERAGEKLPFYATWNVQGVPRGRPPPTTVRLLQNADGGWTPIERSNVIDLSVAEVVALLPPA